MGTSSPGNHVFLYRNLQQSDPGSGRNANFTGKNMGGGGECGELLRR